MNKHFKDAKYYLKRAGEHTRAGVSEELEPVRERFTELTGSEEEPDPSRLENIQGRLSSLEDRVEDETGDVVANARSRLNAYRQKTN